MIGTVYFCNPEWGLQMNKDKYVFAQFSAFLDHNKFRRLINKYNGDF